MAVLMLWPSKIIYANVVVGCHLMGAKHLKCVEVSWPAHSNSGSGEMIKIYYVLSGTDKIQRPSRRWETNSFTAVSVHLICIVDGGYEGAVSDCPRVCMLPGKNTVQRDKR